MIGMTCMLNREPKAALTTWWYCDMQQTTSAILHSMVLLAIVVNPAGISFFPSFLLYLFSFVFRYWNIHAAHADATSDAA